MSWQDRLRENIQFTSPEGREFTALWRGNDRTKSKKLGAFSPPKRAGTIFQDLDVDATKYPITFIFDGDNHDIEANLFFETCNENGIWIIEHPTFGTLRLQLVSVTEKSQPISSGNMTEFESEWVEPLEEDQIVSSAELAQLIAAELVIANQATSDQLNAVADQTTASRIQALKDAAESTVNKINNGLNSISQLNAEIARLTNGIQRATTTSLGNPTLVLNSLASQIQLLAQAPSLASQNISERVNQYANVFSALSGNNSSDPSPENKNVLAIKELALASIVATFPLIITSGDLTTRQEAINLAELLSNLFDSMTNDLDEAQDFFKDNLLENQYFSQSESYSNLLRLLALAVKFLLQASFDLKIEKVFTLDRDRAPIEITIAEYGELGENDINYDLFLESNNLKEDEILLLRAGREVRVYV